MNKKMLILMWALILIGLAIIARQVYATLEIQPVEENNTAPAYYDSQTHLTDYNKTLIVPDFNLKTVFFHQSIVIPAQTSIYKVVLNISDYNFTNSNFVFTPTLEMKEYYIDNVQILGFITLDNSTIKMYLRNNLNEDVNVTVNGAVIGDLQ